MVEAEVSRWTSGARAWAIRVGLVLGTYALLWRGSHLLREWELKRYAEFRLLLWQWWGAMVVFFLAGVVLAVAARFPLPRARFAWGRLAMALLLLVPPIHLTLLMKGWIHPHWLVTPWWFDDSAVAQLSTVLAGVAVGCGFGARRGRQPDEVAHAP